MQPIEGIEYFYLDKIKVLETRQSHSPCTCIQQGLNISTLDNIFVIFRLIFPDGIFLPVRTLDHSLGGLAICPISKVEVSAHVPRLEFSTCEYSLSSSRFVICD